MLHPTRNLSLFQSANTLLCRKSKLKRKLIHIINLNIKHTLLVSLLLFLMTIVSAFTPAIILVHPILENNNNHANTKNVNRPSVSALGLVRSSSSSSSSSSSALFISSWGVSGPPHRWSDSSSLTKENPETNLQSYLPEPSAVEARDTIDGTCLVSGLVNVARTKKNNNNSNNDQFLLELLNHQDSAFEFTKIIVLVPDPALARKRLISRSARYTGLLDKLEFYQAAAAAEKEEGVIIMAEAKAEVEVEAEAAATSTAATSTTATLETEKNPAAATVAAAAVAPPPAAVATVATSSGVILPTPEQLQNVKSWVAVLDLEDEDDSSLPSSSTTRLSSLANIAELIRTRPASSTLKNVAILLTNANDLDPHACQQALEQLQTACAGASSSSTHQNKDDQVVVLTLVAVGRLQNDVPEGKVAYQYQTFGTAEGFLPNKAVFSREEAYRMISELLQLECGSHQALCFAGLYNANATETRLIKGLREAGYARPQEIDHMIRLGPQAYLKAIDDFLTENPDAKHGYTTSDAWWEREEFQLSRRRSAEREAEKRAALQDERTQAVEAIAKEWAKREYFRQSMAGTIPNDVQSEDDFIKSIWDRALFEGDLKYRQSKGEVTDDEKELADFKTRQEKKQGVMLARAKQELKDILQSENLGGEDIDSALADDDDDDDEDDDDDDD